MKRNPKLDLDVVRAIRGAFYYALSWTLPRQARMWLWYIAASIADALAKLRERG